MIGPIKDRELANMSVELVKLEKVPDHPWIRAVAEFRVYGLRLRGLKLEQHPEGWRLTPPGRRLRGGWQSVFSIDDRRLQQAMMEAMLHHGGV
jgi:hypothetical protein